MEKMMGDNEYLKSLVDGVERKIKNEVQKRLSNDYEAKNWLESQIQNFRDEIVILS
jgi:hypothetical protein